MAKIANKIMRNLVQLGDSQVAEHSQRFFKTAKGEYGEGDIFLGIRVPVLRKFVKKYLSIPLVETEHLLQSEYHEIRLFAVILLGEKYRRAKEPERNAIYDLYLSNTAKINNWDIVDASAHKIVGHHLYAKDRAKLYDLARSTIMWERRIAIIATFHFIRHNQFVDVVKIAEMLLYDKEDLIHKAVGWMLREMGKRSLSTLESFLIKHASTMPRTMLRYAIEKIPQKRRVLYLNARKGLP